MIQGVRFLDLLPEQQQLLQEIGFIKNTYKKKWQMNYEYAKIYYKHYGNLFIPQNFKTDDGITHDENGKINLGTWICTQRTNFSNLSSEKQQLLQEIGFIKNTYKEKWQTNYEYAKIYYKHYGNLFIPQNFKTDDGITHDENGKINLGAWICTQRTNFSNLSQEQQQLLQEIDFVVKPHEEKWQNNYRLAKIYYEHYGNLLIPKRFKTNDGFTYEENGNVSLGIWIGTQRMKCDLTSERGRMLNQIGMVWNIRKNDEDITNVCLENNINPEKNKVILSYISVQELQSKIEFLKTHNISIVDENGLLIDIFSMSSPDMKEKYGVSLEEIIDKYYIKNQKRKGV